MDRSGSSGINTATSVESHEMKIYGKKIERGASLKRDTVTSQQGFTLIETVIALVVMLIAGLGISSLFIYSIQYNSGANDRAIATAIAQQQLEQLRALTVTGTSPSLITAFENADLSDGVAGPGTGTLTTNLPNVVTAGRTFDVQKTVCSRPQSSCLRPNCNGSATLKVITIQVTPLAANGTWASTPITLITQRTVLAAGTN